MDWTILWWILASLLVIAGLAGTVIPAIPGVPLVFAGLFVCAWAGQFEAISWVTLSILAVLTLFAWAVDFIAGALGARYLGAAGISGRGSIDFFKKLQNYEFRLGIPQEDSYGRTHPLSGERVTLLRDVYQKDPAWDKQSDPQIEARFQRVKAKIGRAHV